MPTTITATHNATFTPKTNNKNNNGIKDNKIVNIMMDGWLDEWL